MRDAKPSVLLSAVMGSQKGLQLHGRHHLGHVERVGNEPTSGDPVNLLFRQFERERFTEVERGPTYPDGYLLPAVFCHCLATQI